MINVVMCMCILVFMINVVHVHLPRRRSYNIVYLPVPSPRSTELPPRPTHRNKTTEQVFPAFATIASWLWFMKIMKISPVGVPGIAGPPIPALIINSIIVLVILINLIVNWEWLETVSEATDDFPDFSPLARFILVSVLPVVSHLIAFKHRQTDWKVQPDGVDPL